MSESLAPAPYPVLINGIYRLQEEKTLKVIGGDEQKFRKGTTFDAGLNDGDSETVRLTGCAAPHAIVDVLRSDMRRLFACEGIKQFPATNEAAPATI